MPSAMMRLRERRASLRRLVLALLAGGFAAIAIHSPARAADRFSEALGVAPLAVLDAKPLGATPWEALASLGNDIDLGLHIARPAIEAAVAKAIAGAFESTADLAVEDGSLKISGHELVLQPQTMRLVVRARVETSFFSAHLAAATALRPVLEPKGIGLVAGGLTTQVESAALRRLTLNPANAAEKAGPQIEAARARLAAALEEAVRSIALPLAFPEAAAAHAKKDPPVKSPIVASATMIDGDGLHILGRLSGSPARPDDALLTGSLAAAGLTADQYRAAFTAVQAKTLATTGDGTELVIAARALPNLIGEASSSNCAAVALETEPVTVAGSLKLSEPPVAPACRKIAESCAAAELCSHESECQDRVVERTVQETVKVPYQREVCHEREYICYGWGPYGCAYGENVCVAPGRVTDYREKVVERVVNEVEHAETSTCQALRDLKAKQPGACSAKIDTAQCGLVTGDGGLAACETRSSILNRMRSKPGAQVSARLVMRGRIETCTARTLSRGGPGTARLVTKGAGKADLVAEVTVRPEGRGEDADLRCTLSAGPAFKGSLKVRFEKTGSAPVNLLSRDGRLLLGTRGGVEKITIPLDKPAIEKMFGAGATYSCTIAGAGGPPFATWETKVGPALRDIVAKAGSLSATLAIPGGEAELPSVDLFGQPAAARLDGERVVFSAAE